MSSTDPAMPLAKAAENLLRAGFVEHRRELREHTVRSVLDDHTGSHLPAQQGAGRLGKRDLTFGGCGRGQWQGRGRTRLWRMRK